MNWNQIPSLASLRAFEATARLGTFSAAARSLNVTHAAIAQHVRSLEEYFAVDLVFRSGRRMDLTDSGKQLSASLHSGFSEIEVGVRGLREDSGKKPVHITLTPTFAENWLMPRLGGFWAEHPEVDLVLKPSTKLSDLKAEGLDLAIRYGNGNWPGYLCERLTSTRLAIVASPKLIEGDPGFDVSRLQDFHWLLESQVSEHRLWAESLGFSFNNLNITEFDTNNLVLAATRAGYGISVQAAVLVERDLEDGTLISLLEAEEFESGYYLLTLKKRKSPQLETFIKWLLCCT